MAPGLEELASHWGRDIHNVRGTRILELYSLSSDLSSTTYELCNTGQGTDLTVPQSFLT